MGSNNKSERKALEQKWSFSEIIRHLADSEIDGVNTKGIEALLYNYGLASQLIHADESALNFMEDRALRGPEERLLLERAHVCRMMSDQVALWYFSTLTLCHHYKTSLNDRRSMKESFENFSRLTGPYLEISI